MPAWLAMYVVAVRRYGGPTVWYLSCATSFWRWSKLLFGGTSAVLHAGWWTCFLFALLCSSVYLAFLLLLLLLLFKACFRYASDALVLACTALELLLAEGLRAVVAILCCLQDL